MNIHSAIAVLTAHLVFLSSISFGGFPTILPDVREFVVITHHWMTDQEFTNYFALAQAVPGPNMILMMSFVGWKVWGVPGGLLAAFATFGPPCAIYFAANRLWDRFRDASWQKLLREALVPVTVGLIIASGVVMARTADAGWPAAAVTVAAAIAMFQRWLNPFLIVLVAGALGGLGWL